MKNTLQRLGGLDGIEYYVDLFPRLLPEHSASLLAEKDVRRVIELLRQAANSGPKDASTAFEAYRRRGELRAMRHLATAAPDFDWTGEYADWQRKIQSQVSQIEERANLCHRERVVCPEYATWLQRVAVLREELELYPDNPACQQNLVKQCLDEIEQALTAEKGRLLSRTADLLQTLEEGQTAMEVADYAAARNYLTGARTCVERDDFVVGCRRLEQAESILFQGTRGRDEVANASRRPLPRRSYPRAEGKGRASGEVRSPFAELLDIARRPLERCVADASPFMWRPEVIDEVRAADGFVTRHAQFRPEDWGGYFKSLRVWLGLHTSKRLVPPMPNLVANNNFWSCPGVRGGPKAIFAFTQPWQGAPFYADREGRDRILAILHLAIPREEWRRVAIIEQYVARAIEHLVAEARKGTSHEGQFASQGLVLVLLPGDFFSFRPYRQFYEAIRLGHDLDIKDRLAFVDDLDLLRIVSLDSDSRFRGLLEMALPRFPTAYQQTYQDSSAVTPMMFFGREQELAALENKNVTVLFSGRKMGKSSLLRHHFQRCHESTDRRAIWVGCAGTSPWRSWRILEDIAVGLKELLTREGLASGIDWPQEESVILEKGVSRESAFHEISDRIKARFKTFLSEAMERLRSQRNVTRLFILLDEADSFARAEWIENSGGDIQSQSSVSWFLRDRATEYQGSLRVIFAGYDELGRKENLCHSAFGNWGEMLELGPLEENAARRLIIEPMAALGILVDRDLADRILDYTSGHASLIQAFCGQLIEVVRRGKTDWPLQDVSLEFDDVLAVANQPGYQEQVMKTLGLNLGIARTYPLELVFYSLVSPTGLGKGKRLSTEGFTLQDAEAQMSGSREPVRALGPTTLEAAMDWLVQLGLMETLAKESPRKYRFKARYYVNILRSQNAFADRLRQSLDTWNRLNEQAESVPRHVWTIPDDQLATLFDDNIPVCVVCGLPGSGREFLATVLGGQGVVIRPADEPSWQESLERSLAAGQMYRRIVVLDGKDHVPWLVAQSILARHTKGAPPLRWIAGPGTAWELSGDIETYLSLEPIGMGSLSVLELDGWAARRMGDRPTSTPPGTVIPDGEKASILRSTGGLLPILEFVRRCYKNSLPDPFTAQHITNLASTHLGAKQQAATHWARELATKIPSEFRRGLQHLYRMCHDHDSGRESYSRLDLDALRDLEAEKLGGWCRPEQWNHLLEAALLIGLVQYSVEPGELCVPHSSILGLLVRQPAFVGAI